MSKVIVLDQGHYFGNNIGVNPDYREGTEMYRLGFYMKYELEKYGFEVYLTRYNREINPTLVQRATYAKSKRADMVLSLHTNAASESAVGAVIYNSVMRKDKQGFAEELTVALNKAMDTGYNYKPRAVKYKWNSSGTADYYGILRNTVTDPNVEYSYIVEHGFHTNKIECAWLMNYDNLYKLAVAVATEVGRLYGATKKIVDSYTDYMNRKKLDNIILGLPEEVTPPVQPEPSEEYTLYTVQSGDSLYRIAARELGDGDRYPEIVELNNLSNPNNIYPGQKLKIPLEGAVEEETYTEYIVKSGDSLWTIASKTMGSGSKYKELAKFNGMDTTDIIHPGDVLRIPV